MYGGLAIVTNGPGAALRQPADERERVRAVLRGRRRPGRRRLRAEELVQRDPRRRAAGHRDGEVEEAVGAVRRSSPGRSGTVGVPTRLLKLRSKKTVAAPAARASAGFTVPEVNASVSPGFCGSGASCAGEVDPERVRVGDAALARERAPRQDQGGADGGEHDGGTHALVVAWEPAGAGMILGVSTGSIAAKGRRAGKSRVGRAARPGRARRQGGSLRGDRRARDPGRARRPRGEPGQGRRAAHDRRAAVRQGAARAARVRPRRATRSGGSRRAFSTGTARAKGRRDSSSAPAALGKAGWYGILCGLTVSTLVGNGSGDGNEQKTTAGVFERPFGRYLVYAAGLAFVGAAAFNGWRAVTCKFNKKLKTGEMSDAEETAATGVGILGHLARDGRLRPDRRLPPREPPGSTTRRRREGSTAPCSSSRSSRTAASCSAPSRVGLFAYALYCLVQARYRRI